MIDSSSSKYDKFLLLDDLNSEPTEEAMKSFCQMHNLKNLLDNLHATETPKLLYIFETRHSNFPKMTLTVLKSSFAQEKPSILSDHNYEFSNYTVFREEILNKMSDSNL